MAEHKEITWKELNGTQEYFLLDIRDKAAFQYGNVKKSVNIPMEELEERINEIPKDQKIAVYCKRGMVSKEAVELLCENGRDARRRLFEISVRNDAGGRRKQYRPESRY